MEGIAGAESDYAGASVQAYDCAVRPYYGSLSKREFARQLRASPTPAESAVWQLVRGRRLYGLKFRRQHPIAGFLVDFCCEELKIVLEIDGSIHQLKSEKVADGQRASAMARKGYMILRIGNDAVSRDQLQALLSPFLPLTRIR
jgi:very-short-patch-repair endonuclease